MFRSGFGVIRVFGGGGGGGGRGRMVNQFMPNRLVPFLQQTVTPKLEPYNPEPAQKHLETSVENPKTTMDTVPPSPKQPVDEHGPKP